MSVSSNLSVEKVRHMKRMYLMEEILAVVAAIGVVVVTQETNLDNLILAWSLTGSVGAALASIALWTPETMKGRVSMFIANCLIGLIFAPSVLGLLKGRLETNMANTLAVSATISLGTFAVLRPLGPVLSALLVCKLEQWFGQKIDDIFKPPEDHK